MSGRRERRATHAAAPSRPRRKLLAGITMLALAGTSVAVGLVSASPASAAAVTAKVQLSLSGLADSKNPVGGSVIGIRPGDSVSFTTASVPTAGLDKLGLDNLLGGLLGLAAPIQSSANFAKLPGGKNATVVKTKPAVTFKFPKAGTYNFTWTMKKVSVLGLVPINLDGNQLAGAGVKLNANNEYVGKVVVSNNPPKGGLSIQLPKVEVEPSIPIVGKLPKITIPGVQAPTVTVPSLGSLAPSLPSLPTTKPSSGGGSTSAKTTSPSINYKLPGQNVPEQVVPGGNVNEIFVNAGGSSGDFNGGALPRNGSALGAKAASSDKSGTSDAENPSNVSNAGNTVELAADNGTPSSQLPVILAVLAIIALALVAGTYARLFLLKKPS